MASLSSAFLALEALLGPRLGPQSEGESSGERRDLRPKNLFEVLWTDKLGLVLPDLEPN